MSDEPDMPEMLDFPDPKDRLKTKEESFFQKWHRIMEGLNAPKESGEYKFAIFSLQRLFGPGSTSTVVCGLILLLLIVFVSTKMIEPPC